MSDQPNSGATSAPLDFPLGNLILLAAAGFLTMLTEAVPAGLLPAMAQGLDAADALTGQLLTAYAGASMLMAIPLVAATKHIPRKPLILATVLGIAVANLITAISPMFWLTMVARLVGGGAAALQWALLAGYAMRMVDPAHQGRALSVAMAGIPLALAFGVPFGAFLGDLFGWRFVFMGIAASGVLLALAGARALPVIKSENAATGTVLSALRLPGLGIVLIGAGAFQLGHMNFYTYVAPFLIEQGNPLPVSSFLLVLGLAAVAGLVFTGAVVDKHLALLATTAMMLFAVGMLLVATIDAVPAMIVAIIAWGLGLGAAPTVFQTACARVSGPQIDQAQSLLVTVFNAGMAGGSALGGGLLAKMGSAANLPLVSVGIFVGIAVLLLATHNRSLPAGAASLNAM